MSEDMKIEKLGIIVDDINNNLINACCGDNEEKIKGKDDWIVNAKCLLSLIFDDNDLNEFGKVIVDKAILFIDWLMLNNTPESATNWLNSMNSELKMATISSNRFSALYLLKKELPEVSVENPKSKLVFMEKVARGFPIDRANGSFYTVGYMFLFWALMIITMDESQNEKLSLICEFANMACITDEELIDMLNVIKVIYGKIEDAHIKTENVRTLFADILAKYRRF